MPTTSYNSFSSLVFFSLSMSFGWISFGMIYVTLNGTSSQVAYSLGWPSDEIDTIITWSSGLIIFGVACSNIIGSLFLSNVSRRKSLMIADSLIIIGSICNLSSSVPLFLVGRMILGLAMGLNHLVIPIFIREMSPKEISGTLGSFNKICFSSGNFIAFGMTLGLSVYPEESNYWMSIILMPVVFSLGRLSLLFFYFKHDSPKYYFTSNNSTEAKNAIAKIYRPEATEAIYSSLAKEGQDSENSISTAKLISGYKRQLLVCILLDAIYEFSGYDAINFYSTSILLGESLDSNDVVGTRFVNLGIGALRIIANFVASSLLDRLGRKKLYMAGGVMMAFSMLTLSLSLIWEFETFQKISVLVYSAAMACSFAIINPIYAAECLPFEGCGILGLIENVFALMVVLSFPLLSDGLGTHSATLLYFIAIVVGLVGVENSVVETKGLTMEEIYQKFKNFGKVAILGNKLLELGPVDKNAN